MNLRKDHYREREPLRSQTHRGDPVVKAASGWGFPPRGPRRAVSATAVGDRDGRGLACVRAPRGPRGRFLFRAGSGSSCRGGVVWGASSSPPPAPHPSPAPPQPAVGCPCLADAADPPRPHRWGGVGGAAAPTPAAREGSPRLLGQEGPGGQAPGSVRSPCERLPSETGVLGLAWPAGRASVARPDRPKGLGRKLPRSLLPVARS